MGTDTDKTLTRQGRRVAAWIYAVMNPIIESLERETGLLERGNFTWRSNSKRCEYIRTIQEYVDSKQWPNYKDFLLEHENAIFVKTFAEHDDELKRVNSAAQEVYQGVMSWRQFSETVESLLDSYESKKASEPQWPSYNLVRKELVQVAAENVINNLQSLPSHYTYSFFWNYAGQQLLQFRNPPNFPNLHGAQAQLREISSALKGGLEDHRLNLSRNYDVPAAPVPDLPIDY